MGRMFKKSGETLELITNPDMYLFVENAKRGGMSFIGHRYAKANNKDMNNFDPRNVSQPVESRGIWVTIHTV